MKKLLSISLVATISLVSSTGVSACAWTTPPLSVSQITDIMKHLEKNSIACAIDSPVSKTEKIFNGGIIDKVTFPTAQVADLQNPDSKDALSRARTFSDQITTVVSNNIAQLVDNGQGFNQQPDDFYQTNHIDNTKFKSYYFTVQLQNIYAARTTGLRNTSVPSWVYSNTTTNKPFKNFKTKDDKTIAVTDQNPNPASGGDTTYSLLSISQIWFNGGIYQLINNRAEKVIIPLIDSQNNQYYQFRFLVSFSPDKKFGSDKSTAFYVDYQLRSE